MTLPAFFHYPKSFLPVFMVLIALYIAFYTSGVYTIIRPEIDLLVMLPVMLMTWEYGLKKGGLSLIGFLLIAYLFTDHQAVQYAFFPDIFVRLVIFLIISAFALRSYTITQQFQIELDKRQNLEAELVALHNALSCLFQADTLINLGQQITHAVVKEFGQTDCGILLVDYETENMIRLARAGEYQVSTVASLTLSGRGLVPEAVRTGKLIYAPDVHQDSRYVSNARKTRSELVIPLQTANGIIGVLDLQSPSLDAFSEQDQRILTTYAEKAATAIENKQLYQRVQRHASELEWQVICRTADLKETKERVEAILNNSSDAIMLAYPDGIIQQVNPAFTKLFGYTPKTIIGRSLLSLPDEDHFTLLQNAIHEVVNTSEPRHVEIPIPHTAGHLFDADIILSPILGEDLHTTGIVCSVRDDTARKQAEIALRQSQLQLQAIIDNTQAVIYVKNRQRQYILVNRQYEKVFQVERTFVQNKTSHDIFPSHIADALRDNDLQVIDSQKSLKFEEALLQNDGIHTYLSNKFPLFDTSGQLVGMCGISTDITDHKHLEEHLRDALEKEKELSELKSRFVVMMSHEFRTPMAIIQSSGSLLNNYFDRLDEEKRKRHLQRITQQISYMTALLDDILLIEHAETKTMDCHKVWTSFPELVKDLVAESAAQYPENPILYSPSVEECHIATDSEFVQQILNNLISNAIKYSSSGSPVTVALAIEGQEIHLSIRDEGIGISEEEQPHIFEAFHRASNTSNVQGTGLGLAITKRLAELLGGRIDFKSRAGEGSMFTLILPVEDNISDNLSDI